MILSQTGHLSLSALCRVTEEQQKEACKVLTSIDQPGSNEPKNESASAVAEPQVESPAPLIANTLFENPQNCTISVQIYNNQQCPFQGMKITVHHEPESSDGILVDSIFFFF